MQQCLKKTSGVGLALFALFYLFSPLASAQEDKKAYADFRTVVSQIAKTNLAAVVHIKALRQSKARTVPEPRLEEFLKDLSLPPFMTFNLTQNQTETGSGLIISEQGHILTHQRLVLGAEQIQVILNNNQRYNSLLIGTDPQTELAVLRIQGNGPFPRLIFGNSDQLELGEWVIALGHGREIDPTVTQGIICANHNKVIGEQIDYKNLVRTDAVINAGNQGGPLLNTKGEVIGINFLSVTRPGHLQGLGLAIPANLAQKAAKKIMAGSPMERGWIGIKIIDLTAEQARDLDLDSVKGALITDIIKNSPADQGGFNKGDVVISFQDKEIRSSAELQDEISRMAIGREVKVGIIRKAARQFLRVKVGKQEEAGDQGLSAIKLRLGADVRALTEQEARQYRPAGSGQGVAVVWVDPEGPLHEIGLEKGDLILQINGRPIQDRNDLMEFAQSSGAGQWVTLLALDHRTKRSGYVQVMLR